jgi:hypothetical protein
MSMLLRRTRMESEQGMSEQGMSEQGMSIAPPGPPGCALLFSTRDFPPRNSIFLPLQGNGGRRNRSRSKDRL